MADGTIAAIHKFPAREKALVTATGHRAALHEAPRAGRLLTPRQRAYQQL